MQKKESVCTLYRLGVVKREGRGRVLRMYNVDGMLFKGIKGIYFNREVV